MTSLDSARTCRARDRNRLQRVLVAAMVAGLLPVAASGQQPEPEACRAGAHRPAVLVTLRGFKAPTGFVTVYLYGGDPAAFLEHARSLQRMEIAVTSRQPMRICLPAPRPGRYAVSVRHDVDGNRSRFDMNDGGGFSRNPHLSLIHLRPSLAEVLIDVGQAVQSADVVLNYRFGWSIHPVTDQARPVQ